MGLPDWVRIKKSGLKIFWSRIRVESNPSIPEPCTALLINVKSTVLAESQTLLLGLKLAKSHNLIKVHLKRTSCNYIKRYLGLILHALKMQFYCKTFCDFRSCSKTDPFVLSSERLMLRQIS